MQRVEERRARMKKVLSALKRLYGEPKTELRYTQPHELLFAVMLSAQCTDARVNQVTPSLFATYPTLSDYANASRTELRKAIASISFPNNKALHMKKSAERLIETYGGEVPRSMEDLLTLYGVARKTANVVRGELFDEWDGIAIDTHVKRFARKLDLSDAATPEGLERDLCALVPKKDWKYVNNGLVLYGRYTCKALPHDCAAHPLTRIWPPAKSRWPKSG